MKKYLSIVLCMVVIMISGCTQNENNDDKNVTENTTETVSQTESQSEPNIIETDEYGYKSRNVTVKEATGYLVSEDDTPILYTYLTYPYIDNPDELTGISELNLMYSIMDKQVAESYTNSKLANEANEQYKKDGKNFIPYTAQCCISVTFNKGNVISLMVEREEFTNKNEGNYTRRGDTRYLDTNENVKLTDIFEMSEDEIKKNVITGIKEMIKKEPDKYYNNAESIVESAVDECIKKGSWYIKDDGVAFAVDPTVIAPYLTGCVEYVYEFNGEEKNFCN